MSSTKIKNFVAFFFIKWMKFCMHLRTRFESWVNQLLELEDQNFSKLIGIFKNIIWNIFYYDNFTDLSDWLYMCNFSVTSQNWNQGLIPLFNSRNKCAENFLSRLNLFLNLSSSSSSYSIKNVLSLLST